nr:uncharacterized protein LOC109191620 [Ipomoea trifida]
MREQGAIRPPTVSKDESRDDGGDGGGRAHRPVGEFAGGTAAECAMVCCCPCAVLDFLVFAFYRVPVGISGDDGVSDAAAAASCADRRG